MVLIIKLVLCEFVFFLSNQLLSEVSWSAEDNWVMLTRLPHKLHTFVSRSCICHYISKYPLPSYQENSSVLIHIKKVKRIIGSLFCRSNSRWGNMELLLSVHSPGWWKCSRGRCCRLQHSGLALSSCQTTHSSSGKVCIHFILPH